MREGCSCNAWVRGSTRQVLRWRAEHTCPDRPSTEGDLHVGAGAQVEHANQWEGDRVHIGFQPNPHGKPPAPA